MANKVENKWGIRAYQPSENFEVGVSYLTGISGIAYGQDVTYKGKYVGFIYSTGAISHFQRFYSYDVEYGNVDGWGECKAFKNQYDFEVYIEEHFEEILHLLETTDFD